MRGEFLKCRGLVKRFGAVTAVDGADFDAGRGGTYALLGPSGCGKTTFLRLIAGFERADAGSVEIAGETVTGPGRFVPPERRRVGLVFQNYALFPHLTVEANVAFGLRGGNRRKRANEVLELVGLAGLGRRMPHELSGGQQQRVALARALAAKPHLLLLDEPFSNLDPAMRGRVRTEVRQLIEALGVTAIFVTHDQEEALSLADRVAVMMHGRIIQVGHPADIYLRPVTRDVAEFLGDANILPGEVDKGSVQCEIGNVFVDTALSGPVDVMIRPESLVLSAEGGLPVEVTSCEYYGHDQMVKVRLPSGLPVKVRLLPSRDLERGQRLGLQVKGDVVVFPRAR